MSKTRYPRSSARPIYFTVALLGVLGLAGVIVMLIAMADVPRPSYYLLISAFGLLIIALTAALAVLLATNTRRPWGIDPNLGPPPVALLAEEPEHVGAHADDEQARHAVQLPDGNGYGRRKRDDPEVVRRLITKLEQQDEEIPLLRGRPDWATEVLPPQYRQEVAAELAEEPDTPAITEVPIDQLDLLPATSDDTNRNQGRANGGV